MALVLSDRIKETTTTTGTGTYNLGGAVTGFETFTTNLSNSDTTYYCCTDGTDFEVGLGTFTSSGTTLARTTILASSNSNNAVSWSSGTRTIFCTLPAAKSVFLDASGNATLGADLSVGDDLTILGGLVDLRSNSGSPSQIKFYCEVSNAHAQTLTAQVHSVAANNTLTLPAGGNSTLVSETHTQTLTNKTLTAPTMTGTSTMADLDISGDVDVDGTLEADAITVGGTALNTVIAGVTVTNATNATNSSHVLVTDNESTSEENLITFVEGATSSTGNVGLEMDGTLTYNPSTGTVSSTIFKGNIDAVDGDFDGTLEADAITLNGTAITATATLSTGISNNNVPKFTSGVADDDFLRVAGTAIEGRSASEVLSDIGATTAALAADEATALAIALG